MDNLWDLSSKKLKVKGRDLKAINLLYRIVKLFTDVRADKIEETVVSLYANVQNSLSPEEVKL